MMRAAPPTGWIDEAVEAFGRDGYVVVPGLVEPGELAALQHDATALIDSGGTNHPEPADYFVDDGVFHRVQYVFNKSTNGAFVRLLGHPDVLAIARAILGDEIVCAGEALVFKLPYVGREVAVHADCNTSDERLRHPFFNVDVYLDDATSENGCLMVAKGSHVSPPDPRPALDELVEVPVKAGDVIVHDCRLIHGSQRSASPTTRRTLYYEFHSVANLLAQGGPRPEFAHNDEWVRDRRRLMDVAVAVRAGQVMPRDVNLRLALGYNKYI